jgi:hypothetical protein
VSTQPPGPPGLPEPQPQSQPQPEPQSQPQWQLAGPAQPAPDVLTSAVPPAVSPDGRPRRPRSVVLVAVAAVVALVLGGAAYAGSRLWYGSGTLPEEATPSTVLGFVRLDLSPGYGQRLKINNLLEKFPEGGGEEALDELKEELFDTLDVDETAYRKHVEPWFADRIGAAFWLDGSKRPYALIVLAVDDEAAARAGLGELRRAAGEEEFGFTLRDGWALVAKGARDAQAAADAAGREAERESLAASAQFRGDADWLPARQTALAWADLTRVGEVVEDLAGRPETTGVDGAPSLSQLLGSASGLQVGGVAGGVAGIAGLQGRMILGAQATDDGVEVRLRGFGTHDQAQLAAPGVRSTVDALPADSAVAGALGVPDIGAALGGLIPDVGGGLPEELLRELPPAEAEEARQEMAESTRRLEALDEALSAVAGAKVSIAVTDVTGDAPALAASAETGSAGNAGALAGALRQLGGGMKVSTSGAKVEVTTGGYVAGGGKLADQALYRQALAGAPGNASAVFYVDVQRVLAEAPMTGEDRAQVAPVKAVGVATGIEDGDVVGLIRIVID